jgi:hypothetical protein
MELENENINFNYEKLEEYNNKLDQINKRIDFLLDEFIKKYVMANMNPNNEEMRRRSENVNSNIIEINDKLFSMSNDIKFNIDIINKELFKLDVLIKEERKKNKKLRKELGMVEDQNISASEMITDYGEIYDRNYLRNWGLFISTIICIFTIRSIYNNRIV